MYKKKNALAILVSLDAREGRGKKPAITKALSKGEKVLIYDASYTVNSCWCHS